MQAQQLLKLLHHPLDITPREVTSLCDLVKRYPYFQVVYMLLAKAAYDADSSTSAQVVQTAAVYATDRRRLKMLLEYVSPFIAAEPVQGTLPANAVPSESMTVEEVNPRDFYCGYIHAIQRRRQLKITKQKSLAQLHSIQTFLQKDVQFRPKLPQHDVPYEVSSCDLTQTSTILRDDLATENLARVLQRQGKWQSALAIYEKLVLKFPEKKAYFAPIVEQLRRRT